MSHTREPWKVGTKQEHGTGVSGPLGVSVAWCGLAMTVGEGGSYGILTREAEANARLCAAAPDMLEALEQCLKALEVATTPLPEDRREVLEAQAVARAAITKAWVEAIDRRRP